MLNYIQAVANARLVGTEMARLTSALTQQQLSHPSKIHALGYSLGAQVISYMANNITGLHRITGLKIMIAEVEMSSCPCIKYSPHKIPFPLQADMNKISLKTIQYLN